MTAYEQGGAEVPARHLISPKTGKRGKFTKAALKRAVAIDPTEVVLYSTSMRGGFRGKASDLPVGVTFNVVGPDPYSSRDWYASVTRSDNGNVTVK